MSASRRAALTALAGAGGGALEVRENGSAQLTATAAPAAVVEILDPRAYAYILRGGLGAAQAYMEGWWEAADLTALMRCLAENFDAANRLDDTWRKWQRRLVQAGAALRTRSRRRAARDIRAHYDLGNDFFQLFLDQSNAYSCAVYPTPEASLEAAQQHKLRLVCEKLELAAGDNFLDLGCGWGSLAFYAAEHYGCQTTALTLSPAQSDYVRREIDRRGVGDRMQVVRADYRDFTPPAAFSKIASIEMIEAVGGRGFGEYFRRLAALLAPRGKALIQAILIPEHRYTTALREADFIRHYIFPGGALPSIGVITHAADTAGLQTLHLEEIGGHYVSTLAEWRRRFNTRRDKVRALGFDERFCRMWEYYFCYCEGGFAARTIGDAQIVFTARA